ncbi:MAG: DUF4855 domain-containing protein [Clostridia bacterium]|nr:DUF4855 domain-containing protein [Clostridia bacterium]
MKLTKTFLALMLAACMLFAVACTDNSEQTSSEAESEESSADVSDTSSKPESTLSSSTEFTQKIDSLLSDSANRNTGSMNLLKGLSYTTSIAAHADYPDNTKLLTDGNKPVSFGTDVWAGYYGRSSKPFMLDFDLGAVKEHLLDFSVRALNLESYGIGAPAAIAVYIAGEDKEYNLVGKALKPATLASNESWDYSVLLQGEVSARYIRFEITHGSSVWMFLGEATATAYSEEYSDSLSGTVNGDSYYGFKGVPEIETPEYWSESESDFNEEINLVAGVTPMMTAGASINSELATAWYNSKTFAQLSDGKRASVTEISDPAWFHITRANSRTIVFDLGKTSAVSGFSVGFLRDASAGVEMPRHLTVRISENGKDWQALYFEKSVTGTGNNYIRRIEEDFDKTYKARYVEVYFMVNTHVYVDEITVVGKKNVAKASDIVPDDPTEGGVASKGYITPDEFCGVDNMLLSYHCLVDGSGNPTEDGLITAEEYLPYVAYLDKDGKIVDTFFDSFLYLPYTRFNYSDYGRSADGWKVYVDNIFHEDRNMAALNECVGNVYSQLGLNEKAKVFTSILYTFPHLDSGAANTFGDLDGDGKREDFTRISDRKKAIKWIMDEEFKRFKKGNYENLEFCGFYWFEEAITYSDPHEEELIAFAVDYAHKLGVKIFWIPYQQATGYADWEELGFDLACMQPNYMFASSSTSDVLYSTANETQMLGMCVEIEINDPSSRNDAARYNEYLIAGAQTGYMNAVKIYYQNGVPGAFSYCCSSEDPAIRKIYDDTYLYAKCKYIVQDLSEITVSATPLEFKCKANKKFTGNVDLSAVAEYGGKLVLAESPRYGTVCINSDGSFTFTPAKDYVGEDSFSICIDLGYTRSEPAVITIISE